MSFRDMRKNLSDCVIRLLALDDTPERIARAFAVGVFLAFSPLIGLHLLLGPFLFAFLLSAFSYVAALSLLRRRRAR